MLWAVLKSMDVFTQHGDVYIVPDFNGYTLDQLLEKGYNDYFQFKIIDSVYFKSKEKGTVVQQHPLSGSRVKHSHFILPHLKNFLRK